MSTSGIVWLSVVVVASVALVLWLDRR